ncbi:MAG: hypothetical protein HRT57_05030 [Crocinitomicaceae bacterium]|nr:hypothetical protein [Crocinitomicaceae bacterium]
MKNYVILLMLFSVLSCYGQKPLKEFYLKRSLKQEGLSYTFTVLDVEKHSVRKYREDKFYYWYKAQHVLSTQGNSSGTLLHGKFETFYSNKQLSSKGQFNKGLKQGHWLYWRKDGTLEKSENWSMGRQLGTQRFYDATGQENETLTLGKGKSKRKVSDSLIVTNHNQTITVYDSIGNITRVEHRKNGALDGKVKTYEGGKLVETETYRNGIKVEKAADDSTKANSDKFGAKMKAWFKNLFSKKEDDAKASDGESEDDPPAADSPIADDPTKIDTVIDE